MKSQSALWAIGLIALGTLLSTVAAGRLALRPLTPQELQRALAEAGINAAELKPMGRATPSAVAGLGGFALGVANGVGGALIFDLLTSPEVAAYINNLINSESASKDGHTDNGDTTQEVCFSSRSLNGDQIQARSDYDKDVNDDDILDYENDDDVNEKGEERQVDYNYSSDYGDVGTGYGNGLTCIVVNRGQEIVRHRRNVDLESRPSQTK